MNNEKLQHMIGKGIFDVPCEHCGSKDTDFYNAKDVEFCSDRGFGTIMFTCNECGADFIVWVDFQYQITKICY